VGAGRSGAGRGAHEVGQGAQVRGVRVRDEHAVQRRQQRLQRPQQAGVVRVVPAAVQQQPEAVDLPAPRALLRAARPAQGRAPCSGPRAARGARPRPPPARGAVWSERGLHSSQGLPGPIQALTGAAGHSGGSRRVTASEARAAGAAPRAGRRAARLTLRRTAAYMQSAFPCCVAACCVNQPALVSLDNAMHLHG
jgi:hypothetical protein